MRAMLEIKSVSRGKKGDTIKLIEEPIDRLPPRVELRGGKTDGQQASAKSMRFDKESGTLTLCDAASGAEVLSLDGDLTLTDGWSPDADGTPMGSCKWAFETGRLEAGAIGSLFAGDSLRADWKPAQREMEFTAGVRATAKQRPTEAFRDAEKKLDKKLRKVD